MAKTKITRKKSGARVATRAQAKEKDSLYLLKLLLYLMIGTQWLRVVHDGSVIPIPLGLLVGLVFALHEHFQIDRKIEFALLLIAAMVGYVVQFGMYVSY